MKKKGVILLSTALAVWTFSSCLEKDVFPKNEEEKKEFNEFKYSTTQDVALRVSYQNMGDIQASVYFEVYDQMPVEDNGYRLVKKEGVEPLYADQTAADGTFSGKVTLPAYAKTVYIYTPAFYARTLITAEIAGGTASADDAVTTDSRAVAVTGGSYECLTVKKEGWKPYLGTYSASSGKVDYVYQDSKLAFTSTQKSTLLNAQSRIINSQTECPEEYRASQDMYVNENAEIAVTLLGGNTCWNSSVGYYYYPDGQAPATLQEANIVLIFPNTQDGKWEHWGTKRRPANAVGVTRGTAVQLKYYPRIAQGSKEGETTVFPKGVRIGFVLACNTWTGRLDGFDRDQAYRSATSGGLSVDDKGVPYGEPRTAIYRYNNKELSAVVFSFEDNNDQNFSDVVMTLKSNPIEAITDIPEVSEEDEKSTAKVLKGVYAFEDLWPATGDYDMNDVVVESRYEKVFDTSSQNKGLYEESCCLTTYQNKVAKQNGLGVQLSNYSSNAKIKLTLDGKELPVKKEGDVILLTDQVGSHVGKEYKLTITYEQPTKKSEMIARPFIWRPSASGIWEVHIAQEAPTPLVDSSYFGQEDDASDASKGAYYVRKGNYPFGFFLSGATKSSIGRLLESENESKPIDTLYEGYAGWVSSGGTLNTDWYTK